MPIELNPAGPESNPDMLLGLAHGHTVMVPTSALLALLGSQVGGSAIARTAAQLAAAPSSADIALGASAQFYDPAQAVDATHPWVYYSASATAYVPITSASGSGVVVPSAEAADRPLTNADLGKNLVSSGGARAYTLNTGRLAGFTCAFTGQMSLSGASTATYTDDRKSGETGTPFSTLVQTGVDTYSLRGTKP